MSSVCHIFMTVFRCQFMSTWHCEQPNSHEMWLVYLDSRKQHQQWCDVKKPWLYSFFRLMNFYHLWWGAGWSCGTTCICRTANQWVPDSISFASWETLGLILDSCFMLCHIIMLVTPLLCWFPCLLGTCLFKSDVLKTLSSIHLSIHSSVLPGSLVI